MSNNVKELEEKLAVLTSVVESLIGDDNDYDDEVKLDVKAWRGESMKGKKMSACPPEFLLMLAGTLSYFASKEQAEGKLFNGKPSWIGAAKRAARARKWALRNAMRGDLPAPVAKAPAAPSGGNPFAKQKPPPPAPPQASFDDVPPDDDGIPF